MNLHSHKGGVYGVKVDVEFGRVAILCGVRHGGGDDESECVLSRATCTPTSDTGHREDEGEGGRRGKRMMAMNVQS